MTEHVGLDRMPVTALKGVGPRNAEKLDRLGIRTVQDVLFHLPLRYQDRTRILPVGGLRAGDHAMIEGEVELSEVRFGRRRSLLVRLADGTGFITLRFFHFSTAQQRGLSRGTCLRCFGEVRNGPASLEMIHPEYQRLADGQEVAAETSLTPVYPSTEGVHQQSWRSLTEGALSMLAPAAHTLPEYLPQKLLSQLRLPNLVDALRLLHRPPVGTDITALTDLSHPARQRLVFEELLAHQVSLRQLRHAHRQTRAPELRGTGKLSARMRRHLPFQLTAAQERVGTEIGKDMAAGFPMLRMVQGDVGAGKTVVAALAALQAIEADHQVALMAPTELLAEQHLNSFRHWLEPLGLSPAWLTGRHKGKERRAVLDEIANGQAQLIVGTHALFQGDVQFHALGLAIIDEQHRFGVHQRLALREKGGRDGRIPHQLIMTATPIPRSLAMTAYADLDLSVIDELPPGRTPVVTAVVPDSRRQDVIERVRQACTAGRQAYWVCTLIEESEALQCQAAEDTATQLTEILPELRVGLIHGRLKAAEKEAMMGWFQEGKLDLLVATTVIEVGVDVSNASLMIIENPERLGLAQLHQLRGRVGRGTEESHCVLMYHAPLSDNARERLAILRDTSDGFRISQKDLEMRGPGEVLGTRQTGDMQFRIADLVQDQPLMGAVQHAADILLEDSPQRAEALVRRWLGHRPDYGRV